MTDESSGVTPQEAARPDDDVPKADRSSNFENGTDAGRNPPVEAVSESGLPAPPPLMQSGMEFDGSTSREELKRQLRNLRVEKGRADFAAFCALWQALPRIRALKDVCGGDEFAGEAWECFGIKKQQAYDVVRYRLGEEPRHTEVWNVTMGAATESHGDDCDYPRLGTLISIYKRRDKPTGEADDADGDSGDADDDQSEAAETRPNRPRKALLAEIDQLRYVARERLTMIEQLREEIQRMARDNADLCQKLLNSQAPNLPDLEPEQLEAFLNGEFSADECEAGEREFNLKGWPGRGSKLLARSLRLSFYMLCKAASITVPSAVMAQKPEWFRALGGKKLRTALAIARDMTVQSQKESEDGQT